MATKLKNLKIHKVDFVDEGANPDAHIMLYKSKDGNSQDPEGKKEADPEEEGSGSEGKSADEGEQKETEKGCGESKTEKECKPKNRNRGLC